jgi:hypothetical protein
MLDVDRQDIRAAIIRGLISVAFAVPIAYVALDMYVSMTVSVMEDPELYGTMFRGAMYAVGFGSFFSGFFSTLFTLRGE